MIPIKFRKDVLILVFFFILVACNGKLEANMSEQMVDFSFMTQNETSLSLDELQGEWWIANFMYTNCRAVCPITTANLVHVQMELKNEDFHPRIISFSIDPAYDSPEILRTYSEDYGVDLESWTFLTGYEFKEIQEIAQETFRFPLSEGAQNQRAHGYSFYLVNPKGEIVKEYDGMSEEELELLVQDLKKVL